MTEVAAYEAMSLELGDDGVATLTLRRPDALNALNLELKAELGDALRRVAPDPQVRALLLTGEGRAFCAGGDIKQMDPDRRPPESRRRMLKILDEIAIPLARLEKPVVAAVNGHAHGAGFSLALAADIVIAGESASFGLAFARLGLIPDTAALYFLPRLLGVNKAKELVFTARRLSPEEARELGLVQSVVPDDELMARAGETAASLAAGPTIALGLAKRLLDQSSMLTMEDMAQLEAYGQAVAMGTEDHREGIAAFTEKRAARFTGT